MKTKRTRNHVVVWMTPRDVRAVYETIAGNPNPARQRRAFVIATDLLLKSGEKQETNPPYENPEKNLK